MTSVDPSRASSASQANGSSQPGSAGPPAVVGSQPAAASSSQAPRSYAHATRHSVSSAPLVVGATPQHGKADTVNKQNPTANMAAPPVANSGAPTGPAGAAHEHTRKPSVTISAAGSTGQMPNGAPAAPATRHNISFGAMGPGGNPPAIANSTPYHQQTASLSAVQNDPRISSPNASPSPIPQPAASGGRPPERPQAQNNVPSFGSLHEGAPNSHGPSPGPGMQGQNAHYRRASTQSQHSDMQGAGMSMSPNVSRGGYGNGPGRGRGGYNSNYGGPYNSPGPAFRGIQTPNRNGSGFAPHFQNQGIPHHNSHGPSRSPAPMNSNPGTPTMASVPMHGQPVYPSYPGYTQQLSGHPAHFQAQPDYQQYHNYYGQQYPMPPNYMPGPPQTPRGGFKGQPQMPHQQFGHPPFNQPPSQSMSRTSSQVSERPASSIGGSAQPPTSSTPSNNQVSHGHSQSTSAASQSSNFQIPTKSKVTIKTTDGKVLNFDKNSSPAPESKGPSPAPVAQSTVPPPAPAPQASAAAPSAPAASSTTTAQTVSHTRTESKSTKTAAEIRQEFIDSVKKEQEKETQPLKEESAVVPETSVKPEDAAPVDPPRTSALTTHSAPSQDDSSKSTPASSQQTATAASTTDSSTANESESAPAAAASDNRADQNEESDEERKKREADEEFERMVAEMEAQERAEEEKEKAFQEKRKKEQAEKAAREKEEAANADEQMKQAEREAEAREEQRAREKPSEASSADKDAEAQRLFASLKKPAIGPGAEEAQPEDSGASTPAASETSRDRDSMPPPAARASKSVGISRAKPPAALKLETSKAVEAAQPTPGMRSLRSARMLQLQTESITYPEGIQSPNPALNQSGRRGGRLYDTDFLMQFQEAFKEKPSLDWDQKVKETLGDSNDPPKSARGAPPNTPGGRGGNRMPQPFPSQSAMGSFTNRRPGGPGGPMNFDPKNIVNPPIGQFGAGRPPFMGGASGMGRAPSGQGPNQANHSQRGGSQRGSKAGSKMSFKQQEQANQKMPLTAGADLKPLEASTSGWKPMSLGRPAAPTEAGSHMAPDMVQRKVKSNLNKMTPERFEKIADQIMEIAGQSKDETDGRTLRQVIALTFEKACDEAHWASMYAQFCQRMLHQMSQEIKDENVRDKAGNPVVGGALFRKYLLTRCQEEFERGWVVNLPENPEGQSDEAAMLSDEYYKAAAAKRKGLGLVQFIGELYKLRMLSIKIMHQCVTRLLDFEGEPDEAAIESLSKLLRTVGSTMEAEAGGPQLIKVYFERIDKIMTENKLASRLHFMLLDVVDLRKGGWRDKDAQKGPKTIQEIHEEALAAQQKADMERQKQNQRGGGGRMPSGRQDARNFNPPPPQDYNRNTLGTDDLRKLNQKREPRGPGLGPKTSLGPSMIGSRSSSGRQGLGPPGGGLMSRTGSQAGSSPGGSGMHSRSASIKADPKKDEEPKTNVNAFSALAGMDGDGAEASSPPATKAQPASDKKPE